MYLSPDSAALPGTARHSKLICPMNELTDQLITLFSATLIAIMLIAVAAGVCRQSQAHGIKRPLKWNIPVDHLDGLDMAMCGIVVLYFSMGALMAAATLLARARPLAVV